MQFSDLDLDKTYTYADYFSWKFAERTELIKGKVFRMSPAPNRIHQKITGQVFVQLAAYLEDKTCEVYIAPFDVRLPGKAGDDTAITTVLQPDVCVICDLQKLDKKGCLGAPDIVVEVMSPGNNARELKKKYELYEEAGVKEYWLISPQNQWLRINTLVNDHYQESPYYTPGDTAASGILPAFRLEISSLFKGIDPDDL